MKYKRDLFLSRLVPKEGCLIYTGALRTDGYGRYNNRPAHRLAYELSRGPIPDGMTVDHLCFVPLCCNPMHLRLLTRAENQGNQRRARKEICLRGHPLSGDNLVLNTNGCRGCRTCRRENRRKRYEAYKAARIEDAEVAALFGVDAT